MSIFHSFLVSWRHVPLGRSQGTWASFIQDTLDKTIGVNLIEDTQVAIPGKPAGSGDQQ